MVYLVDNLVVSFYRYVHVHPLVVEVPILICDSIVVKEFVGKDCIVKL